MDQRANAVWHCHTVVTVGEDTGDRFIDAMRSKIERLNVVYY